MPVSEHEISKIKRLIRKDERFKRIKKAFDVAPQYNLAFEDLHKEIDTLFQTRNVHGLHNKRHEGHFVDNVIEAMLRDQSMRSRLTEINVMCLRTERSFSKTLDHLKDYILVHFDKYLRKWGTKEERKRFVEVCMRKFLEYLAAVQELRQKIELIVSDIDKAGYALKNTIEAINLLSKPEARI